MAKNGTFHISLPVLYGKRWERLFRQVKVVFAVHDVYEQVTNGMEPFLVNATSVLRNVHKELKKKDDKASFLIHERVDAKKFEKIAEAANYKEA